MSKELKEYPLENLLVDIQPGFARKPTKSGNMVHLRTNNISPDGTLDLSKLKSVSASISEVKKYSLKEGDVLFNNTNSDIWVGKTAYVDRPLSFLYSNHLTRLRADKTKVDPQYLAIYLHKLQREGYFKFISTRWVNQTAVNTTSLRRLVLKIPSLEKQRSTVAIITQTSNLRQKREQANQIANKILQAVFMQMFGDPVNNSKWIQKRILDVSIVVESGSTPLRTKPENFDVNGIPLMKVENIGPSGYLAFKKNQLRISQTANAKQRRSALREDDVLINIVGPPLGKVASVTKEFEGANINQAVVLIRPDHSHLDRVYLWSLLRFPSFNQMIINMSVSVRQANINLSEMRNLKIPVPPLELQQKFALYVKRIEGIRERQYLSKLKIDELFDSLKSKAFNGELVS